jgi:subtilisin-like proprotein convertase family protein
MSLPSDTLFAQQWHLHNTAAGEYDLNVAKVWDEYTGKGVKVFVIDDGFDYAHPDLSPNYDTANDHDYGNGDDDAAPFSSADKHGTAVMGIIGAARDGTGVVGVAYGSTLIGARINYDVATADGWTANFVAALASAVTLDADVVNMSFSGDYDFDSYSGAANVLLEKAAIDDALANGRGGLGLALIKSAGNARVVDADVNHNQADNNSGQIIVAAVNRDGFVSSYSSYGAPVLVSAFGSPSEIVTTDRLGTAGYDPGDFMLSFNGTSAAAPMVSGVVTLMLQANDQLGWRDIQTILADTARHVGSIVDGSTLAGSELNAWHWNDASNWNGGGMHYSEDYGYGLVDALAAVRLAESWTLQSTSTNQNSGSLDILDTPTAIPDNNSAGTPFTGTMNTSLVIERVTVTVDFSTTFSRDIVVYLKGPDGREERLIAFSGHGSYDDAFTFHSQAFRGELSNGDWQVRIADGAPEDLITVSDISIKVFGSTPSKNDTYVYTNEFSDYAGNQHLKNLRDTNGGSDLLNASAVSAAMSVNLTAGTGTIDGVAMKIAGIEKVFGGDGKDHLTGNTANNDLAGGRNADILLGGKGADDFIYRVLGDSLDGSRHDLIRDFGKGNDRIDLSDIDTLAKSGDQGFKFAGDDKSFNGKDGELHFVLFDKSGTKNDHTMVEADLDGDKTADFQIDLTGLHHLAKGDFIL